MQAVVSTMASIVVSDDTIETDVKIIFITYAAVYSIHIQILVSRSFNDGLDRRKDHERK